MSWKDFFYFSRRERNGILVLIIFIAGVFLGRWLFTEKSETSMPEETFIVQVDTTLEMKPYIPDQEPVANKQPRAAVQPQPSGSEKRTYYNKVETPPASKPTYPKQEKYAQGTIVELNTADTTELKKIPGIGSAFAKRIVGYRKLLGGYYTREQLQEVYGMYEELYEQIAPYFSVDSAIIQPLFVNSSSLDKLKSHPYLNFYQAKAIIELRKKKGKLNGINDLILLEEFTSDDWERLTPYLNFEK